MYAKCLLLPIILVSCTCLGQGDYEPFDLGRVLMQAEQIKRMQAERQLLEQEIKSREEHLNRPEPQQTPQNEQEAYYANLANTFSERIKYRRYRWDDFDTLVFAPDLKISLDMIALMNESRYAADIVYYLGKNPDVSAAIAKMPLPDAGEAIFDIEESIITNLSQLTE